VQEISTEYTDAHNGFEVRVAVKPTDFYAFEDRARQVLAYFPPGSVEVPSHPNLVRPVEYLNRTDKWGARQTGPTSGLRAVVGPVSYSLSRAMLADAINEAASGVRVPYDFYSRNYDLFFDIGEVSVSVSRESLDLDKRTAEAVAKRVLLVMKEEAATFVERIDTAAFSYERELAFSDALRHFNHTTVITDLYKRYYGGPDPEDKGHSPYRFMGVTPLRGARKGYSLKHDKHFGAHSAGLSNSVTTARERGLDPTPLFIYADCKLPGTIGKFLKVNPELLPRASPPRAARRTRSQLATFHDSSSIGTGTG